MNIKPQLNIELVRDIINNLYKDVNGYDISTSERGKYFLKGKSFTYGEVTTESFYKILGPVDPQPQENFYDLGSGAGKAVFLGSLFFDFKKSIGIEKLEELYKISQGVLARFNHEIKPALPKKVKTSTIDFINADFMDYDFSEADIIFTHSTCFEEDLMRALTDKFKKMKKGTGIITVTKTINSDEFFLVKKEEYQLSWGKATVNFYVKV